MVDSCTSLRVSNDISQLKNYDRHAHPEMGVVFKEVTPAFYPAGAFREIMFVVPRPKIRLFATLPPVKICGAREQSQVSYMAYQYEKGLWEDKGFKSRCRSLQKTINERLDVYLSLIHISEPTRPY